MTFRSRGVAPPFTTPLLAGTRVRETEPEGMELVVPNPSGSRGVYILPPSGARTLGPLTVHDTVLLRRCARLAAIDPARVRAAALDVAREGYAGRDAAAAAETAIARDRAQCVRVHDLLVAELMQQLDPGAMQPAERPADLDRRAEAALRRLAPSLGRNMVDLAAALTALSALFAPLGMAGAERDARLVRLLTQLEETRRHLSAWLTSDPRNDIAGLSQPIGRALGGTCLVGSAVLETARAALADPLALLRRWIVDPEAVTESASRCDWLLDGWERLCLLWQSAGTPARRRSVLLEMAPLVPELPQEVLAWMDARVPAEALEPGCRIIWRENAWRAGSTGFTLIERNEKLRAMSI